MAKTGTANPATLLGDATRYADLRQRLLFLLGALVVYRIGTFIPVPGIDPVALEQFFQQQSRHDPEHVQHVLGRRAGALVDLRARHHAVHLGVDHHADGTHVIPALAQLRKEGESGRRKITQYTRYGTVLLVRVPVHRAPRRALQTPGRRAESRHRLRDARPRSRS